MQKKKRFAHRVLSLMFHNWNKVREGTARQFDSTRTACSMFGHLKQKVHLETHAPDAFRALRPRPPLRINTVTVQKWK